MRFFSSLVLSFVLLSPLALAGPLNDTGIDFCRDPVTGADTTVTPTTTCTAAQGRQDARFGRDPAAARSALTKVGAGSKGFDFTKIANNGTALPASAALGSAATDWACTFDNNTGLMWEVKVNSASHLRHQNHSYSWYNSVNNYGGNAGTLSGGTCQTAGRCDTEKFVADVNAAALCGKTDWRMPRLNELYQIADRGIADPGPTIHATYFPNTPASEFWSGSPFAGVSDGAWGVYFASGFDYAFFRSATFQVRLVRAGQ